MKTSFNPILYPIGGHSWRSAVHLLRMLKVKVSNLTLKDTLQSHPDYPSLLSISDSLNRWNIRTLAVKITVDKLDELSCPFIAHLEIKGGLFTTIKAVNDKEILYLNNRGKAQVLDRAEFLEQWNGVSLLAEADEYSGEPLYKQTIKKEWWANMRIPLTLVLLILFGIIQGGAIITRHDPGAV